MYTNLVKTKHSRGLTKLKNKKFSLKVATNTEEAYPYTTNKSSVNTLWLSTAAATIKN